jgi:hypothetical protein
MGGIFGGIFGLLVLAGRWLFMLLLGSRTANRLPKALAAITAGTLLGLFAGRLFVPMWQIGFSIEFLLTGILALIERAFRED